MSTSRHLYGAFSYYAKLNKHAIKTGGSLWLKSINDDLESKVKTFGKMSLNFQKDNHVATQLNIC
jgi:hypothetical protein